MENVIGSQFSGGKFFLLKVANFQGIGLVADGGAFSGYGLGS